MSVATAQPETDHSHIITRDIVVPGVRRFEAGELVSENEVGSTIGYMTKYGYAKSLEDVRAEADAADEDSGLFAEAAPEETGGSNEPPESSQQPKKKRRSRKPE